MSATSGVQGFGFEQWLQPFREALSGFQFPMGAAPMSGFNAWPGVGGWPGSIGAPPSFGTGMPNPFTLDTGPFSALFEQISTLAQGQWQQLATQYALGGVGSDEALSGWNKLLESLTPPAGFSAAMPAGMDPAQWREMLSTPQVGPMREHAERWQQLLLAQLDQQEARRALGAQLGEILKLAMDHFRQRLAARAEPGKQIGSMRELFDEWIEAGEQAWAERASDDAFVAALGQYSNAQMRVRAAQAEQVNRVAKRLGLPTREEVDSDHRRIAHMERELRRMQRELDELRGAAAEPVGSAPVLAESVRSAARARKRPATTATRRGAAAATKKAASKAEAVSPKPVRKRTASAAPAASAAAKDKKAKPTRARRIKASTFPVVTAPRAIGTKPRKPASKAAARKRATS